MTIMPILPQRSNSAEHVFRAFLKTIVAEGVFSDAERSEQSGILRESEKKEIDAGKRIDARTPRLAAISGKGGWVPDPEKATRYARFTNVSLLDHLCSVVRGALVFAELDLKESGVADAELEPRLARIAAIGFLHDADKMLGLSRTEDLSPDHIRDLVKRYSVDRFLESFGRNIQPAILLACIDEVELTRAGRLREGMPVPPRDLLRDCAYVRLADRLDGKLLDTDPQSGGVEAVLKELANFAGLRNEAIEKNMRVVRIEDPHSPFLLDELQAGLSDACLVRHGIRPLIEIHHDGRLLCVLPADGFEHVVRDALRFATAPLNGSIRIDINARGAIRLLDAPASLSELIKVVEEASPKTREDLLRVAKAFALQQHTRLDDLFASTPYLPKWPERLGAFGGQLVPLFRIEAAIDDGLNAFLVDAQTVGCTLCCPPARKDIRDEAHRERELLELLKQSRNFELPSWLAEADKISRRSVLAALAAGYAQQDVDLRDKLLGPDGLGVLWLEGRGERKGLNAGIDASGSRLAGAVEKHFGALIRHQLVVAQDESAEGRCHFINQPVRSDAAISTSTGLYAVNISAFSGRDGRPETFRSPVAETLVSPIAEAEHRLRQIRFGRPSERRDVAVRVSSPTTAGLFPALVFDCGSSEHFALTKELGFSDILRRKLDGGKLTFSDLDGQERRIRIARYEEMPTRCVGSGSEPGQIGFIRMVFEVARRTGRPVHLFRGLPRPNPAFVSFDALPQAIELMLVGREFRLEQINEKISFLRSIEDIAKTTGLGLELALAIGDPRTRFGSACDALARCDRRADGEPHLQSIRAFLINLVEKSEILMSNDDRALVAFGEAMSRVQRAPNSSDGANVSETGIRVACEAAEAAIGMRQTSSEAIAAAVAGELQNTLKRRNLYARAEIRGGEKLDDALAGAVEVFVRDVWFGAFGGKSPALKKRRVAIATYRWAFERAARKHRAPAVVVDAV